MKYYSHTHRDFERLRNKLDKWEKKRNEFLIDINYLEKLIEEAQKEINKYEEKIGIKNE